MELGKIGVWNGLLRSADPSVTNEAVAEIESLGYGTIWFPGGAGREVLDVADRLLRETSRVAIATGILNIWAFEPEEVAQRYTDLSGRFPSRFLLGLGVGHKSNVERDIGRTYEQPYSAMVEFLDGLDASVPNDGRVLAALGPKMLRLARDRSLGAHPYLVSSAHTAAARELLGKDALLAPEQSVVLETDPARAREIGRSLLARYLVLPNYTNNMARYGLTAEDFSDKGSDRLVDEIVAWGDESTIANRVREHLDAGADHVCIQVVTENPTSFPTEEWRRLAPALLALS